MSNVQMSNCPKLCLFLILVNARFPMQVDTSPESFSYLHSQKTPISSKKLHLSPTLSKGEGGGFSLEI